MKRPQLVARGSVTARIGRAVLMYEEVPTMSIGNKITSFLRGRNGQRLVERAQRFAARPENQRRLAQLRERIAAQRQRTNRH